jgi:N-acetylglucosaminyl-diphospho-decaprenol L-rhamnosyltransferase
VVASSIESFAGEGTPWAQRSEMTTKPISVPVTASVIIPSLVGGKPLLALVAQLGSQTELATQIIIADNGLPDHTVAALRSHRVEVLRMPRNLGFGAAVNRAAEAAEGDALVVLNDDVIPQIGFLEALVAPLKDGADTVAGVLIQNERPERIETAGVVIDAALGPHDYLHGEPLTRLSQSIPPPLGPCGGAAAYQRALFAEVGGFDESLFAYGEDVDLAIRMRSVGARSALAWTARALHLGSQTLGYHSLEKAMLVGFGRGYLLRKYRVLNRPTSALAALGIETAASVVLARRHRSLQPGLARIRGWRACKVRAVPPPKSDVMVGISEGWRRRYLRSSRFRN